MVTVRISVDEPEGLKRARANLLKWRPHLRLMHKFGRAARNRNRPGVSLRRCKMWHRTAWRWFDKLSIASLGITKGDIP